MGNAVVAEGRRNTWALKMKEQRGNVNDTSENYLQFLMVNNHNMAKKVFDEADAQTQSTLLRLLGVDEYF